MTIIINIAKYSVYNICYRDKNNRYNTNNYCKYIINKINK